MGLTTLFLTVLTHWILSGFFTYQVYYWLSKQIAMGLLLVDSDDHLSAWVMLKWNMHCPQVCFIPQEYRSNIIVLIIEVQTNSSYCGSHRSDSSNHKFFMWDTWRWALLQKIMQQNEFIIAWNNYECTYCCEVHWSWDSTWRNGSCNSECHVYDKTSQWQNINVTCIVVLMWDFAYWVSEWTTITIKASMMVMTVPSHPFQWDLLLVQGVHSLDTKGDPEFQSRPGTIRHLVGRGGSLSLMVLQCNKGM